MSSIKGQQNTYKGLKQLLVFDVKSYFAHFRKHFSTTSSLSYSFPPRTAIVGLIAAILGRERDSYYSDFTSDKCRIALQIMSPVRHITSTVNYLMTDKPLTLKKLRGQTDSMQVHVDMLISGERDLSPVSYRIFFNHIDEELFNEVAERVEKGLFSYPPYLGTANNLAWIEFVDFVDAEISRIEGEVEIHTVIPRSILKEVAPQYDRRIYIEDLVPADFASDRSLSRVETYIYEGDGKPLKVVISGDVFSSTVRGVKVNGVFM